jgi:hypothetical protein
MTGLRLRYVQSFVDRKTGAVFHYFRKRGHQRVRLPGLPPVLRNSLRLISVP